MSMMRAPPPRAPRRFRRRILLVTLCAGLLPAVAWGLGVRELLGGFLSVSLAPLGKLLERVSVELGREHGAPEIAQQVASAQLNLEQAELVRQSLLRLAPRSFLVVLLVSAGLTALAGALLGRALTARVEAVVRAMERYAQGDLSPQLPAREGAGADELDFLASELNRMGAELLSQRERIKTTEQLAAWQDVARAMAHDLKNPLTAMKMATARLGRVAEGAADAKARREESVALLSEQIDVLIRLTESFSAFARLPPPEPRRIELRPVLEEACQLYREASAGGVRHELAGDLWINADPDQLRRAFGNLVKNAVEAAAQVGSAEPVVVTAKAAGERVLVEIVDGGAGIGQVLGGAELTRGLATTKPGGAGLGLPLSYKIFHDHGGSLRLEPASVKGTRAVVELPLARDVLGRPA